MSGTIHQKRHAELMALARRFHEDADRVEANASSARRLADQVIAGLEDKGDELMMGEMDGLCARLKVGLTGLTHAKMLAEGMKHDATTLLATVVDFMDNATRRAASGQNPTTEGK